MISVWSSRSPVGEIVVVGSAPRGRQNPRFGVDDWGGGNGHLVVIFSLVYLLTQRQCEDWRRRIGWSASMLDDEAARARGHSLGYQDSNLDQLNQNQSCCRLHHTPSDVHHIGRLVPLSWSARRDGLTGHVLSITVRLLSQEVNTGRTIVDKQKS